VAAEVKEKVSEALSEIIQVGARVRPLNLNGKRVGWIRPLSFSERKVMDRHIVEDEERVTVTLLHCTTLTEDEIADLDVHELNSILNRLYKLNLADLSLYPYISAFVTTQSSNNLWTSRHDKLFDRTQIKMFDGKVLPLMALPDHTALWATLSTLRQESIQKLEQTLNFGTLIKAWAGKSADKYIQDLSKALQRYQLDLIQPWVDVIDYVKLQAKDQGEHFDDGFGHSHEDNTVQGLLREMKGMLEGDKHERVMDSFYEKQINEAKEKEAEIQEIIRKRRMQLEQMEDEGMVIRTDAEVRQRERQIREHSAETRLQQQLHDELSDQPEDEEVPTAQR
jgi:hypothetical protein